MRPWFFLLSAPLLAAASCPTVTKPPSDSKAPTLTWAVQENEGAPQEPDGGATIPGKEGNSYLVVLKANNPGGIHELTLRGKTRWNCATREPIPKVYGGGDIALVEDTHTLTPDPAGSVKTSDLISVKFAIKPNCAGAAFDSGNAHFEGTATNYYGGKTTSTLDINVPAAWSCASGSFTITVYGVSYEEASAKLENACKFMGSNCGSGTPVCRPAASCGARWGCSSDLWVTTKWSDDLPADWQAAFDYCRDHSTVGDRAEVTCYRDLQCKCETELVK